MGVSFKKAFMTPSDHLIFIGGPSGTGKTTIATLLAQRLNGHYIEGDEYHPKANIDKMANGIPLTDEDRWPWLKKLNQVAVSSFSDIKFETDERYIIVSCSLLKKKYRDFIREQNRELPISVKMFMLYDDFDQIYMRMTNRKGHYMKAGMLKSQFADLELPKDDEASDGVFKVYCKNKDPSKIEAEIVQAL